MGVLGIYCHHEPRGTKIGWDMVLAFIGPPLLMTTFMDWYHMGGRCPQTCCSYPAVNELRRSRLRGLGSPDTGGKDDMTVYMEQAYHELAEMGLPVEDVQMPPYPKGWD